MKTLITDLLVDGDDFELFMAIAQGAFDRRYSDDVEPVTDVQRVTVDVWVASGVIGNRGFIDHEPKDMLEWAESYDALGVATAAEAIRSASKIIPPKDSDVGDDDPVWDRIEELESDYYQADEDTDKIIARYIRQNAQDACKNLV